MKHSTIWKAAALASALAPILALPACAQTAQAPTDVSSAQLPEPAVQPAVDGIFAAFETYPLVGIGDRHGLTQLIVFYETLIRDPRFAQDVGNVVVEFGGAAHQDVIDRYVNGEDVPYTELRQVWTNVVGWVPTVQQAFLAHFFFEVREVNMALPPEQRIKVWLGEPPIDWSQIETNEQWQAIVTQRDWHAGALIAENILAQNEKALVIYGSQHFEPGAPEERELFAAVVAADPVAARSRSRALQKVVEDEHPEAFFVAQVYVGFNDAACTARFEESIADWPSPALAVPAPGTTLERDLRACLPAEPETVRQPPAGLRDSLPPEGQAFLDYSLAHPDDELLFMGDAVLFLGPAESLTRSPYMLDAALDSEYRAEIARRWELITGEPLAADYFRNLPATLDAYRFLERDPG